MAAWRLPSRRSGLWTTAPPSRDRCRPPTAKRAVRAPLGCEEPARFFRDLRACSFDRRKALTSSDFRKSLSREPRIRPPRHRQAPTAGPGIADPRKPWASRLFAEQGTPRAAQSGAEALSSRHEDVRLAGLDLLKRARVQVRQLRQPFLREVPGQPLAAEIGPEELQLLGGGVLGSHAPSCRIGDFDRTARHAVKRNVSSYPPRCAYWHRLLAPPASTPLR